MTPHRRFPVRPLRIRSQVSRPLTSGTFEFTPSVMGNYRIDCLVPGHEPAGMWDTLKVVDSGTPSITATGSAGTSS